MILNDDLVTYINKFIIIKYSNFDKGHDENHINYVINKSIKLAERYYADFNMVYVIAAYHDLGMMYDREKHEIISSAIMREDIELKRWFSEEEISIMCKAIEEHRASYGKEPKDIYGKIISQADRNLEINQIVYRAVEYGRKNFPDYNFEQQFERVYNYLIQKYNLGYLKLWLEFEEDQQKLEEVINTVNDKMKLRKIFTTYFFINEIK